MNADLTCRDCNGSGQDGWRVRCDEDIEPCRTCSGVGAVNCEGCYPEAFAAVSLHVAANGATTALCDECLAHTCDCGEEADSIDAGHPVCFGCVEAGLAIAAVEAGIDVGGVLMDFARINSICVALVRVGAVQGDGYAAGRREPDDDAPHGWQVTVDGDPIVLAHTAFDAAHWFARLSAGDLAAVAAVMRAGGLLRLPADEELSRERSETVRRAMEAAEKERREREERQAAREKLPHDERAAADRARWREIIDRKNARERN